MGHRLLKTWAVATVTLGFLAVAIRLAWAASNSMSLDAGALIVLLILGVLNLYCLILYIVLGPTRERLTGLCFKTWFTMTLSSISAAGVIHFIRFLPSPECVWPWSPAIAGLLLAGGLSGYLLVLCVVWSVVNSEPRGS